MAISINWLTKVINVPQADLTSLGGTEYALNVDTFRLALKDIEDGEEGMSFPMTHNHVAPINVGGVALARVIEIINGYTVTFEDTGTPYSVSLQGANSNIGDVVNLNNVSVRSNNSAGLVESGGSGSGATPQEIAQAVWQYLKTNPTTANSMKQVVEKIKNETVLIPATL